MIREIFEKEFSHGNSSPPCSVFFVLCLLVLRARIISWRVSWFPQCILGRHRTREILEPRGFLINTDPGAIFHVYALPADLDQGQKPISSGSTLGMRTSDFFSLCQEPIKWWAPACVQLSPPLKLSPRSLSGGAVHRSSPAVSRPPVPGVQIVECSSTEEREKKIRRKRGRGLSPLPHPLFVCLFVCLFVFLLTSSLRCPHDLNSWNRLVSRARGKLTRKGKKTTTTNKGRVVFIRLRLTRVGPLWTLRSTIWTP